MNPYNGKSKAWEFVQESKRKKRWRKITILSAFLVAIVTTGLLVLPAVTMENDPEKLCCQITPHVHVDSCYDQENNLVCGYADFVVHSHQELCYNSAGELICELEEIEPHTHDDSCYQDTLVKTCGLEESEGHVHTDACYEISDDLICTLEEAPAHTHEGHIHTDACYQVSEELICGQEETVPHMHDVDCYDTQGSLICEKSAEGHSHTQACSSQHKELICLQDTGCYDEQGNLICEKSTEGHTHTQDCYAQQKHLVCGQEETTPHTHTSDCFEAQEILACGKEEIILHTHTSECFDDNGNLICGKTEVLEHVHDESCVPKPDQTETIPQDDINHATVEGVPSANAGAPSFDADAARAGSIDFEPYITNITLSKQENGQWVPVAGEVTSGDTIRVHINYSIPENVVGPDSRVIHYQLPEGVGLRELATGPVTIGDKAAGTYTISTSGLIQITFTEEFADDTAFAGDLEFQGMVTATGEGEQGSIDLGFGGGTIIVKPNEEDSDLTVSKAGYYDKNSNLVKYAITVSTQTGTDGNVTIEDAFIHAPAYGTINYTGIISFEEKDAQGNSTYPFHSIEELAPYLTVTEQTPEKAASFVLKDLPALAAGESYILTYTATPDLNCLGDGNGYLQFTNNVTASDQTNTAQASTNIQVSKAMIAKECKYDVLTRKLQWTIYVNEDQRDISGWTLGDELTYTADGQTYTMELPDTVTITALIDYAPTGESMEVSLPFTFPANSKAQYVITYETEIPTGVSESNITFHNKAWIGDYWVKIDVEGPAPGEYGVIKGAYDVDKETGTIQWLASIAHPAQASVDQLHYVDLISGLVTPDGTKLLDAHYTTRTLLADSLTVMTVDGKTTLTYGTDYKILAVSKADVKSVMEKYSITIDDLSWFVAETPFSEMVKFFPRQDVNSFGPDEPLGMFAVVFEQSAVSKIGDVNLALMYKTQVDKSALPEGTEKIWAVNLSRIPDEYSLAQIEMDFYEKIDKQASPVGVVDGSKDTGSFTDDPLTINSGDAGGRLHYRIMIADYAGKTEITVTDTLPAGAELVTDSVTLRRHPESWNTFTDETQDSYYLQQVHTQKNPDGTTTVTFLIGHLNDLNNDPIGIYYDVSIENDPDLTEGGQKTYVNTASWDGNSDSTTTTVERRLPHLEKSGEHLSDDDILRYYVVINPEGDRLNPYDENLTLEDTLTIPAGSEADFRPNSVQLFQYDPDASENHFCGIEIDPSQYKVEYNEETHTTIFTLPDATPCVLVYEYELYRGTAAGELPVSNVAKLSGEGEYSSEDGMIIEEEQSSATVNKATITIYKYETGNLTKLLPGARFKLQRYEKQTDGSYLWNSTSITSHENGEFVVGEDGSIVLSFLTEEQGGGSMYNTLYRIQEVTAPAGHISTSELYYFVWMQEGENEASTIDEMTQSGALGDVNPEQVEFITYSASHALYVPNDPDQLTVTKVWRNDVGEILLNPSVDRVTVTLYQWTQDGQKTAYGEAVELTADNDWSYTWESLPKTDPSGASYKYTVEETPVPGFETTYSSNNDEGIQIGTIEITNTQTGYVLPETGGRGTFHLMAAGLLLVVTFGIGYGFLRRRCRKGGEAS